ncbi:MAG TPA: VWA domain-containing protein, partial [Pyrinomonadaceae bacterium]|nr:VWA domain-containing protein [Pyrinomonadaceae bacterium]
LRERPLTEAAKAIIRSGDTVLMDAIRRASPKYFGDYTRTLPPMRREPALTVMSTPADVRASSVKIATARVTDLKNRSVSGLIKDDFEITESGETREILNVRPTTTPVNLVLLLDVSGSVDNYVNFIRKAARAFVETVDRNDRVSIVLFNEDVKTLAVSTTDKNQLSKSLDTFDAGGGTAYFDAIGYTLTEILRPLKGERTAIVVLTDGDDNRSFLPLDSLVGSIEESGALIYPLYVPSSLIAAASSDPNAALDPLRSRYLSNDLTTKAEGEGKRLAQVSGGVYYPITQLSQIQTAYEDIVAQLRTAYDITFRSELATADGKPSPRLKVRTKTPNTFVQIRNVISYTNKP